MPLNGMNSEMLRQFVHRAFATVVAIEQRRPRKLLHAGPGEFVHLTVQGKAALAIDAPKKH